jgi:hypothetical protein
MWQYLLIAALAVGLLGPWTSTLVAEESPMIELAVPRPLGRGESVQVQITTGPLPRGARVELFTENGEILGAVTPYPPATRPIWPRCQFLDLPWSTDICGCAWRCSSRARNLARLVRARFNVSTSS